MNLSSSSFDIEQTPIATEEKRPQLGALVSEFMRGYVQNLIHDRNYVICAKFLGWMKQKTSIPYEDLNSLGRIISQIITKEKAKSYFKEARKRKAEESIQFFAEREAKLQRIEKTSQLEFFSDTNLLALILDYLTLDELLQIRICCRYMNNMIQEFGLQLVKKVKILFNLRYCNETKRFSTYVYRTYKKKCLIAGVAKDSINNCLVQHKAKLKTGKFELILFSNSLSYFKDSTLIDLRFSAVKENESIEFDIKSLQEYTIIRGYTLPLDHPIEDVSNNHSLYYLNEFKRSVRDTTMEFINETVQQCNENIQINPNSSQEKLILYFCQDELQQNMIPKSLRTPLKAHLKLFIFDLERVYSIQGSSIYDLKRKATCTLMKRYKCISITDSRQFLKISLCNTMYLKPENEKETEFMQKLQRVYSLLAEYIF